MTLQMRSIRIDGTDYELHDAADRPSGVEYELHEATAGTDAKDYVLRRRSKKDVRSSPFRESYDEWLAEDCLRRAERKQQRAAAEEIRSLQDELQRRNESRAMWGIVWGFPCFYLSAIVLAGSVSAVLGGAVAPVLLVPVAAAGVWFGGRQLIRSVLT